ncbi:histone-lysine N-methyltransferase setd3 [Hyposmocoma kahamanoa]|uniref:histone-lysine N-methyltransferase setd3 n=1 Tax=Hyposmocoma kahamanoa TaxID=1477025 RepID=UPI000E6D645F|nr:histone-lysine N-methyltransferase setd3 [Hyposmocoma kahamanoa]
MGRKSQSKQSSKKNGGKENNKFLQQKRKELVLLVDKLLKLTSTFQATSTVAKSWEHHLEIEVILQEVRNIEAPVHNAKQNARQACLEKYVKWLNENGAQFAGVEICEFIGYDLGLKAVKPFSEGSLILKVPSKVMMTEKDARDSSLSEFIGKDPLLQNMPNITLALFVLLEKNNPESFWKPYIDALPDKYSTILYFTPDELAELKPSPVFESSLKLYRSIARQYAYFYNKIHTLDISGLKNLQDLFTFDNYRWAVSTVMTRQNNIQMSNADITAFIPLWDMCNHEHGKITTEYNKELNQGECYALRDFQPGEQIFIFYGARPNADLFLHNGFVYPHNQHDSLSLALGVSSSDPLRDTKLALLSKLGLAAVTHYNLYRGDNPISPELLAFIRIFNMNQEELTKWSSQGMPGDLVSSEPTNSDAVGAAVDHKAYKYLFTRCGLLKAAYKKSSEDEPDSLHRRNIKLLKECEVQILEGAIHYLESILQKLSTE